MNESTRTLDLHGKNAYQARIMLDAALRASAGEYSLLVIHGNHRGTVLQQLVRTEYARHPGVLRVLARGEGATELILREL